jgi:hypothetical protein
MIILAALLVVLVAVPVTLALIVLTLVASAVGAAAEGTLVRRGAQQSRLQPSPGPASGIRGPSTS